MSDVGCIDQIFEMAVSEAFKQSCCNPISVRQCQHSSQPAFIKLLWQQIIDSKYKAFVYDFEFDEFNYIDTLCKQCCIEFIFITNGLTDFFHFIRKRDVANKISFLLKIIHLIIMLFNHEFALLFILRNKHLFIELNKFLNDVIYNKNRRYVDYDKMVNVFTKSRYSFFICSISYGIFKMYQKMKKYHLNKLSSKLTKELDLKMNILDLPCKFMDHCFDFTENDECIPICIHLCGSFDALKKHFGDLFVGIVFSALFQHRYFTKCFVNRRYNIKCKNRTSTLRTIPQRMLETSHLYKNITDEYLSCIWRGYYHLLFCNKCSLKIQNKVKKQSEKLLQQLMCQYKYCNKTSIQYKLKLCSKCKIAYYCSRKCQKKDWNSFHRNICKIA